MRFATVLKIGVVLIVALVVAVVVFVSSVDFNQYKGFIAQKVKEATGRDLHIEGELDLALSLWPAVVVEGVSFANAPGGSRPQMVTVRRLEAEVALLPLITGNVQVKRLVLIEPDILVETDASKRGNWEFDTSEMTQESTQPADAGEGGTPALHITEVRIERARLTYRNGGSGQTTTLGIGRLSAHADSFGSPIRLSLTAAFNGNPLEVVGTVGALAKFMKNESFPIEMTVKTGGAEVTLDGSVAQPREGKGVDLAI
ncbi:MAG: AsmA family protein, partial [Acidiferrobacterales bacterium]